MARPYIGGSNGAIKAVSADTTLQLADHGKTVVVDGSSAGNITITLPATASCKGFETIIILGAANNAATEVLVTSDTNIVGTICDNTAGSSAYATSGASRGFADASKQGSMCHLISDGSKWLILRWDMDLAAITAFS
tara:strand:- start:3324 stop:3734 length:411 start_codon:yes stop_codon:yes gene_type:complete